MRRLSLDDTVFYNLGDIYMCAAVVLDGPCSVASLLAEIDGVVTALPALAERPVRLGLWNFARSGRPLDLAGHVAIVRDPSVTAPDQLAPHLESLRRSGIPPGRPPWRMFVLNPADGDGAAGEPAVSAILMQIRHGLADAMRVLQILTRMGQYEPAARHRRLAAALQTVDLAALPRDVRIFDAGLSLMQVPRRRIPGEGDAGERLAAVAATLVADPDLFPGARPLRGHVGRTRLVRRRGPANGVGNHLKMVTVPTRPAAPSRRLRIPGLARAQDLPLSQWLVALAPRRLARWMMRLWYANFDAIATLLPVPRNLALGGRHVRAFFGVPPLSGALPLALIAVADGENYNLTVMPGRGLAADRGQLLARIRALLNPGPGDDLSALEAMQAEIDAAQRAGGTPYGQGAGGRSSSPVRVPVRAKSP